MYIIFNKQGLIMGKFRWLNYNSENGDVLLKEFKKLEVKELEYNQDDVIEICVLDTETNGLDYKENKIIELAFIVCLYDKKQKKIVKIIDTYNELNDPEEPLSQEIIELTGITDEDLKDKKIDWNEVNDKLKNVELCICHNARFDRSFFQKYSKVLSNKVWGCSYTQIPWKDEYNFPALKQEVLTLYHGFYYTGHRALTDCEALLTMLILNNPKDDRTYLDILIEESTNIEYLLIAQSTNYNQKSFFNENKFSWAGENKIWYKSLTEKEEAEELFVEMSAEIYKSRRIECEIVEVAPHLKFLPLEIITKIVSLETDFKHNKNMVIVAKKAPYHSIIKTKSGEDKKVETRILFNLRGYDWYNDKKVWYMYVDENEAEVEKEWLREYVYNGDFVGEVVKNRHYKKKSK